MGWLSNFFKSTTEYMTLQKQYNDLKISTDITINDLRQLVQNTKKLYIPEVKGTITWDECMQVFKINGINSSIVELSDLKFSTTSMEEAKKCEVSTGIANKKYVTDAHDCENFSFALLGYFSETLISFAFGTARSKTHRFNCMIDDQKNLWICEPQTNEWTLYSDLKNNQLYTITSLLM